MFRSIILLFFIIPLFAFSQDDLPFQVLATKGASIYGDEVKPLQFVNDVTSIEILEDGYISLVHEGGTTFEKTEKIFTFYLKPEKLKNRKQRPKLETLYLDSAILDQNKVITIQFPRFDRSGFIEWNSNDTFEFYWRLNNQPVLNYIVTISDSNGNKIQDFRTKDSNYIIKPNTFGLQSPLFMIQISSSFAGETIKSKRYQIQLSEAPEYEKKAADYVLKALDLELIPTAALATWKEALAMPNGEFYKELFTLFLTRNEEALTASGEDVSLLLSQNK